MTTPHRLTGLLFAGAALCALAPSATCAAQSLRGSRASIDRMYYGAQSARLDFYETPTGVRRAASAGDLVALSSSSSYTLHRVGFPYAQPTTRAFVQQLGEDYRAACGERLEVTSAVRPASRQPRNSTERSVHPTGMAVDLHKSRNPACLRWLRSTLLDLERDGVVEATEEFSPPHFHVAVFPAPFRQYAAERARPRANSVAQMLAVATVARVRPATNGAESRSGNGIRRGAAKSRYRVRRGDTLWDIARDHDTTVRELAAANHIRRSGIRPGQELVIPSDD